ncbi:hypothetical protein VHUM_04221 [Vanrija humicola]|uniref:Tc1-like transposase DDE domain-containing protein n=1 Tax=Vanrija humicola TaxID=5417 RepID=A0A7D8UYH7_VANHU|nr:hypothetical protein VHUM_04221 [Vanrija humicola]
MKTKHAGGRPPKLSSLDSPKIEQVLKENRRLSLKNLALKCATVAPPVHFSTLRRFLKSEGYKRRLAHRKPLLGIRERRLRRRWHYKTRGLDWRSVIFTDEAQVCASNKGRIWVTCKDNERFLPDFLAPRVPKDVSVLVWGGIWHGGRTPLVRISTSSSAGKRKGFTGELYRHQILKPHLGPAFLRLNNDWRAYGGARVLEDGNRIHFTRFCRAEKGRFNIKGLFHPPNSPDLNCIEHAWAELKRRLNLIEPCPGTKDQLWEAAQRVWTEIPLQFINNLVLSMKKRRNTIRHNLVGPTTY